MTTTLPQYVVTSKSIDVHIATLQLERHSYDNYPEYQREKVWSYTMKRMLIDTIQRGLPIPAILVIWKDHCFLVVDGQQRLTTIFEFLADGFATSRLREDPALEPLEPNKRFSQLSGQAQEAIENYTIQIRVIDQQNEPNLGALFRRLQHQQPLSLGERLWSYSSDARQSVSRLIEHPIWREIYNWQTDQETGLSGEPVFASDRVRSRLHQYYAASSSRRCHWSKRWIDEIGTHRDHLEAIR